MAISETAVLTCKCGHDEAIHAERRGQRTYCLGRTEHKHCRCLHFRRALPPITARPAVRGQLRAMEIAFSELGISEREERLRITSWIVNRSLSSSKELTTREASAVLDELERRMHQAGLAR